jgi:hypothetical protein
MIGWVFSEAFSDFIGFVILKIFAVRSGFKFISARGSMTSFASAGSFVAWYFCSGFYKWLSPLVLSP